MALLAAQLGCSGQLCAAHSSALFMCATLRMASQADMCPQPAAWPFLLVQGDQIADVRIFQ